MASNMQMVIYEGFLAADPEMRYTNGGTQVTNFRIGSNNQYRNSEGEQITQTTWLRITAWGSLAEIINNYCGKGSHVIVVGRLNPGENGSPTVFEGKNGWGASYEVTAQSVRIIKGTDRSGGEVTNMEASTEEDALPFG